MKRIYLDMDGTISDSYNVKDWLVYLNENSVYPYFAAEDLWEDCKIKKVVNELHFDIITQTSKDCNREFFLEIAETKIKWLNDNNYITPVENIHILPFNTPKWLVIPQNIKMSDCILIDDDTTVRENWERQGGLTIDANLTTHTILEKLESLLYEQLKSSSINDSF